ncbi:MAG: signal recognition particle-docking protein FtsY [Deltaproteobacteria bacterium]|nr:MAG: signal recognition particle-docking protein FtsY [Deltaproteobacteria bacterium]
MDAALWQQIVDWAAAHELWIAGGAAIALLLGAIAATRRGRDRRARAEVAPPEVVPAPVEAIAQPAPAVEADAARAEPVAPARLRDRLRRTSDALVGGLGKILGGSVDDALLDQLEELLLHADLGVKTATALLDRVRREGRGRDASAVREILRDAIAEKLRRVESRDGLALAGKPHVVLVLGVNGSGKTTTIGKLAARHVAAGRKVLLGAADTFRAAAIEQLQAWGERTGCEVIAGRQGGDPSAVAFDTVKAALARGADVAIIDTAGRLQTKKPLMEELAKLARVIGRDVAGAPHETLLVLDANTGQNALSQAKLFTEVAPVSGLVLAKLDGTARGGVIVGLADEFGIPVRFVGVGEAAEDLRDFAADEFVDALFAP